MKKLRESWAGVTAAIEELEREGRVLVTRTGKTEQSQEREGQMKMVFLDDIGKEKDPLDQGQSPPPLSLSLLRTYGSSNRFRRRGVDSLPPIFRVSRFVALSQDAHRRRAGAGAQKRCVSVLLSRSSLSRRFHRNELGSSDWTGDSRAIADSRSDRIVGRSSSAHDDQGESQGSQGAWLVKPAVQDHKRASQGPGNRPVEGLRPAEPVTGRSQAFAAARRRGRLALVLFPCCVYDVASSPSIILAFSKSHCRSLASQGLSRLCPSAFHHPSTPRPWLPSRVQAARSVHCRTLAVSCAQKAAANPRAKPRRSRMRKRGRARTTTSTSRMRGLRLRLHNQSRRASRDSAWVHRWARVRE